MLLEEDDGVVRRGASRIVDFEIARKRTARRTQEDRVLCLIVLRSDRLEEDAASSQIEDPVQEDPAGGREKIGGVSLSPTRERPSINLKLQAGDATDPDQLPSSGDD